MVIKYIIVINSAFELTNKCPYMHKYVLILNIQFKSYILSIKVMGTLRNKLHINFKLKFEYEYSYVEYRLVRLFCL